MHRWKLAKPNRFVGEKQIGRDDLHDGPLRVAPFVLGLQLDHLAQVRRANWRGIAKRVLQHSATPGRRAVGGAVVFFCALPHEVTRVTRGARFATLPFLYDESAIRGAAARKAVVKGVESKP